jgi:hypothetical protein
VQPTCTARICLRDRCAELGVTATRLVISFAVPASAWGAAWVNRFMDKAFSYRWFGER